MDEGVPLHRRTDPVLLCALLLPEQAVIDALVTQAGYDGGRPRFNTSTTQAEAVRFHDDQSLYTGVYARGGPTNTNDGYNLSLDAIADR